MRVATKIHVQAHCQGISQQPKGQMPGVQRERSANPRCVLCMLMHAPR